MPDHKTFSATVQRLRKNRECRPRTINRGRDKTQAILHVEPDVLDLVKDNTDLIDRRLAYRVGGVEVCCLANTEPHTYQRVQALKPEDLPRRIAFCEWLLQKKIKNNQTSSENCCQQTR